MPSSVVFFLSLSIMTKIFLYLYIHLFQLDNEILVDIEIGSDHHQPLLLLQNNNNNNNISYSKINPVYYDQHNSAHDGLSEEQLTLIKRWSILYCGDCPVRTCIFRAKNTWGQPAKCQRFLEVGRMANVHRRIYSYFSSNISWFRC